MAVISWDPLLDCGDATIDEQHKALVTTINRLDAAHAWGTGKEVMAFVLDELEIYATVHFETEERLFAARGYPEAEAHKAAHRRFAEQILEIRREFEAGDEEAVGRLLETLGSWLVRHVADEDMKYRPWLPKRSGT